MKYYKRLKTYKASNVEYRLMKFLVSYWDAKGIHEKILSIKQIENLLNKHLKYGIILRNFTMHYINKKGKLS